MNDKELMRAIKQDSRILKYLKSQLKLKEEEMKAYQTPLDQEAARDPRKLEEMVLQRQYFWLKSIVDAAEMMLEEERDNAQGEQS